MGDLVRPVYLCAAIAAFCLIAPPRLYPAEFWLTCGPMAIGGRCKTEGAMGFYNDSREKHLRSQVTCSDQAHKPLARYECYPLSNPSAPGDSELRVICNGKAQRIVLTADQFNDAYLRCPRLCGRCAYGDWQ